MPAALVLSWRKGVTAEVVAERELHVRREEFRLVLRQLDPALAAAFRRLSPAGDDEGRLAESILEAGGTTALAGWYYHLKSLARRALLCRSVHADGQRLATLVPTASALAFAPPAPPSDRKYLLCRFAYLRREGPELVLESPRAYARIVLNDPRTIALVGALATPSTVSDVAERAAGIPSEAIGVLLGLLSNAGMIQEDESPALQCWEFHDLLFHGRSREGRTDAPFGATFRMAGQVEMPPAIKPPGPAEGYPLERPDLERLAREDPPLSRVVEHRRSIREYSERPITARQLGEFLYRVARLKEERETDVETPRGLVRMEIASRPYPSGGALYELEFYAAISACDGLDPGLYHYDSRDHRLGRVRGRTPDVGRLVDGAALAAGIPTGSPQVLIILAARFPRLSWKYSSIAYALILKHVGVVYQTMYLAATAMDLAPCALGVGDSDLFARAAGTEYDAETSVGEFLLGSSPTRPSQ